jgi:hypothetical protein
LLNTGPRSDAGFSLGFASEPYRNPWNPAGTIERPVPRAKDVGGGHFNIDIAGTRDGKILLYEEKSNNAPAWGLTEDRAIKISKPGAVRYQGTPAYNYAALEGFILEGPERTTVFYRPDGSLLLDAEGAPITAAMKEWPASKRKAWLVKEVFDSLPAAKELMDSLYEYAVRMDLISSETGSTIVKTRAIDKFLGDFDISDMNKALEIDSADPSSGFESWRRYREEFGNRNVEMGTIVDDLDNIAMEKDIHGFERLNPQGGKVFYEQVVDDVRKHGLTPEADFIDTVVKFGKSEGRFVRLAESLVGFTKRWD